LLTEGQGNPAAEGFLEFLRSEQAVAVIEAAGYSVP
jgi:molybdate transport system substrate-binding protein